MFERSFHFVPGDRPHWLAKSLHAGADAVIFDLEDAIGTSKKGEAAGCLMSFLEKNPCGPLAFVRVNGEGSPIIREENELLKKNPEIGIVFPKVQDVTHLHTLLLQYPTAVDRKVIILLESALGVENCSQIISTYHSFGVGLGLEDMLSTSLFDRSELDGLVSHTRCRVALAATAHGCLPIDTVSLDTQGGKGFVEDAVNARRCGMQAKFTIHPDQIAPANRIFSPKEGAVREAKELVRQFNTEESVGYGRKEGKIISPPTLAKAKLLSTFVEGHVYEKNN